MYVTLVRAVQHTVALNRLYYISSIVCQLGDSLHISYPGDIYRRTVRINCFSCAKIHLGIFYCNTNHLSHLLKSIFSSTVETAVSCSLLNDKSLSPALVAVVGDETQEHRAQFATKHVLKILQRKAKNILRTCRVQIYKHSEEEGKTQYVY